MSYQKRNALGRGLSALLDSNENDLTPKSEFTGAPLFAGIVATIRIDKIETNPFQPRTSFDEQALAELTESIKQQGIIQPITVRKMSYDLYQVISGERRLRASKMAGLEMIPAYVRIANDQSMLEMALVENIQRENLNALEVALSYQRLIDECGLTQEQLADKVGKERSTVTNYLRLLKLPPQVQKAIRDNIITMGHARAIINVSDPVMQLKIFDDIIKSNLSVRKVEDIVKAGKIKVKPAAASGTLPFEYKRIQDQLARQFETKVEIMQDGKGGGKISFNYFSTEDLNRLLELLDF